MDDTQSLDDFSGMAAALIHLGIGGWNQLSVGGCLTGKCCAVGWDGRIKPDPSQTLVRESICGAEQRLGMVVDWLGCGAAI